MLSRCNGVAWRALCLATLLTAALSGCGGGASDAPDTNAVTGKVTNGSEPLADIRVDFVPTGEGLPCSGTTDAEGVYTISRHTGTPGAPAGNYRVVLTDTKATVDASAYSAGGKTAPTAASSRIPEKWQKSETSPQSVEVKAGDNVIDIDVTKG